MITKRSSLVLIVAFLGLVSGQMLAGERVTSSYKNWLTKLTGATIGGTAGWGLSFKLIPYLFSDARILAESNSYSGGQLVKNTIISRRLSKFDEIVLTFCQYASVALFAWMGAETAYWFTPEGKIENAKRVIAKYESLLTKCMNAGDNLFDVLDTEYVGNDMVLLAAYKTINCARSQLVRLEDGLTKLMNNSEYGVESTNLLSKIILLRQGAQQALIMIARHPQYAQYKQIEEMQKARMQAAFNNCASRF